MSYQGWVGKKQTVELEENLTYKAVRIEDTAEWRLLIWISSRGMSVYLQREWESEEEPGDEATVHDKGENLVKLFSEQWAEEPEHLQDRIETAVYDHPQLLEDFSTELIISTNRFMWVPLSAIEEEGEDELFNMVYSAADDDIFIDQFEDKACLYTLVPGLQGFLRRTLPGARTRCQLSVEVSGLNVDETGCGIYCDIRDGEADYVVFKDGAFFLGVTHSWRYPSEIAYHVLNIIESYDLGDDVKVGIYDPNEIGEEGKKLIEEAGIECRPIGECRPGPDKLPLAMALLTGGKRASTVD